MIKTIKELFKKKKERVSIEEYLTNTPLKERRILKDSEIPQIAEYKCVFILGQCKSRKYSFNETTGRVEYSSNAVEGFAMFPINYEQNLVV